MAKALNFTCSECGTAHARWSGRCEACGAWNAIAQEKPLAAGPAGRSLGAKRGRAVTLEHKVQGNAVAEAAMAVTLREMQNAAQGGGFRPGIVPTAEDAKKASD